MSDYTATIGLEVHAELNTKSKMFCGCKNAPHESEVNANTCPVCLAHPGTLPTINQEAVTKVLRFAYAVGGSVASYSEFDRKNYFYPDIPKAYQISQYQFPFVSGGSIKGVELTRVHLEEDTARSQHDKGEGSIVDFNRAGVPLMELVTEPVIHDAKTAGDFARELQLLLRTLDISEANMERGEMRVEANISVSNTDKLGTKVEVKNLNSFKVVEQAIEFEIKRQTKAIENGEVLIQETRGWDEAKGKTFSQRSKESAEDYRYFPDPDLPRISVNEYEKFSKSRVAESTDNLPQARRDRYSSYGLSSDQVETILFSKQLMLYYENVLQHIEAGKQQKLAANYLLTDLQPHLAAASEEDTVLSEQHFGTIVTMVSDGEISSRVAKDLLSELALCDDNPRKLAEERSLLQSSSAEDLLPTITMILKEHGSVVEEYREGKEAALQFLVGQGMKATKGAANPGVLKETLIAEINK
ncbi:MAG: Asp-tRNA(Asn)/Glu-tRNA(Gln) amidotransferase subunit GatB [Patescibacteria group bacterium]